MADKKRYKVRVYAEKHADIEVNASSEEEAKTKALYEASYGFRNWSGHGPTIPEKTLVVGSAGLNEPFINMPKDWQIYSSMKGADAANARITAVISACLADIIDLGKKDELTLHFIEHKVGTEIAKLNKKFSKFGITDTEPRYAMASILAKAASFYGLDRDRVHDILG